MIVTRFAPSPTGFLHLGSVRAALVARDMGERCLLRIEDIDTARCRPEYAAAIQEDLRWLGLGWDGPVRVQSEHFPEYQVTLDTLAGRGLLYPCFCTRADIAREVAASPIAPHDPDGAPVYPGTCRRMPTAERAARLRWGEPHAMRLDMDAALAAVPEPLAFIDGGSEIPCAPTAFGDVVLARKDTPASYHLCVTHDDAAQGVTLVTRGDDLRPATAVHRLLQALLGWPAPHYLHFPLLRHADGRRLAKREGAPAIRDLRAAGMQPAEILRRAALPGQA